MELSIDQQRVVQKHTLLESFNSDPEAVFNRYQSRIQKLGFDLTASSIFHDFLEAIWMLEGSSVLIDQCLRVDELDASDFADSVKSSVEQTPDLLQRYQAQSLKEVSELLKA